MIDEKNSENLELFAAQIVDIDEKGYKELGEFLNMMEHVLHPLIENKPPAVKKKYDDIVTHVEALILQEIEPIQDLEAHFDEIFEAVEAIKDYFYEDKIPEMETVVEEVKIETDDQDMQEMDIEDEMFADFLEEATDYIDDLENGIIALEEHPKNREIINEVFRPFHTLKGVSGFMGLKKMNKISHETETLLDLARNMKIAVSPTLIDTIFKAIDALKIILSSLTPQKRDEVLSENKLNKVLQLLEAMQQQEKNVPMVAEDDFMDEEADELLPQQKSEKTSDSNIKIKTEKLDYLINTVGELLIASNLIRQDQYILQNNDQIFTNKISQLARVVSELQNAAMALRMIPIGSTFQRMKRVVRDLSKKTKKKIVLDLKGEETEVDRHLVDSLYDPLVHMIRNSCDHGIESPSERQAAGKKEQGNVCLGAYHKGNNFIIDVIDDGKGLNKERILEKAIEKNLIKENEKLSDDQIHKLIFLPGFSTASEITDVSGRGVGMDVVMQSIKTLGGDIHITSEKGKGSTFSLSIPLTLAIIEGLQVKVSDQLFVIPIAQVNRFIRPEKEKINTVVGQGKTIQIEDHLVPILSLEAAFNLEESKMPLDESLLVVVTAGTYQFGIRVDQILSIQDIVVKNLGEKFRDLKGVSGATILGDGSVGLILDVNQLFTFAT